MAESDHPLLKRMAKRGQTGSGRLSETRVAKSLSARLTSNSGAASQKGDMDLERGALRFKAESKSTKNAALQLELAWLVKISTEAFNRGRRPMLTISFTDELGKPRIQDWVAIPKSLFDELTEGRDEG